VGEVLMVNEFFYGEFMTTAQRIRILIVEDQAMMRQGLRAALESYPNIEVVGETDNGEEALVKTGKLYRLSSLWTIRCPRWTALRPRDLSRANILRL
jgi:hypothetical protein